MSRYTQWLAAILILAAVILGVVAWRLALAPRVAPTPAVQPAVEPRAEAPRHAVVVARTAIAAGQTIEAGQLKVVSWPVPLAAGYTDVAALAGKRLRRDVAPDQPITGDAVMVGLAQLLAPGERAVAVAVDEVIGGANQISPGDYVDLFFTLERNEETAGVQARLMQSRLRVLTYGAASVDGPLAGAEPAASGARGASAPARTATLAVPLAHVNEILLAARSGRLQLALRSAADEALVDRALFAPRQPVLAGRSTLSAADRARLDEPANAAYAGESLVQFSNAAAQPARAVAPAAAARPTGDAVGRGSIQVWRAGQPEVVRY